MKAAYIERTGPPEVIQYGELAEPRPEGSQVLVRAEAVAVNPIDTYLRSGIIPAPLPIPYIIGSDLAGKVVAVGPEARRFGPGDRVWCTNQGFFGCQGTFAELVAVEEPWLHPIPDNVEARAAAAMALVGVTAHLGLFREAGLGRGETLMVNGGAGGVGSAVVQMAKIVGARVITTAGSPAKAEICRKLGADEVILYREEDVAGRVRELAPEGVQVWFETLREPPLEMSVPLLAPRGRMLIMAGREARPSLPIGPFYTRDCRLLGFAMFNASVEQMRRAADDINKWMAEGRLRANIGLELSLAEAARAHQLQEESTLGGSGTIHGKIILTVP